MPTDQRARNIHQRIARFSDMTQESNETLLPIKKYDDVPPLPLDIAVEPLIPFLPCIQTYAERAIQRCTDPPADGLTIDESASIRLYSMEEQSQEKPPYAILNAILRSGNEDELEPWLLYLKLFHTALSRLPSARQIVCRGVKCDMGRGYTTGQTKAWSSFSSCTTSINVLQTEQFLGRTGPRTMFVIDCISGKDICNHTDYSHEAEILFLPGVEFKVIGCMDQGNGLHIIQLKEIVPVCPSPPPVPVPHPTEPTPEKQKKPGVSDYVAERKVDKIKDSTSKEKTGMLRYFKHTNSFSR
jgi:hypothetical protein